MNYTPKHRGTNNDHQGLVLVSVVALCLVTGVGIGAAFAGTSDTGGPLQPVATTPAAASSTPGVDAIDTAIKLSGIDSVAVKASRMGDADTRNGERP